MSQYTQNLSIQPFPTEHGWQWCLTAPLVWELGCLGSALTVTVPDGFVTDLATIPGWARFLFNGYAPETAKAAAVHDYLLSLGWNQQGAAGEFYWALEADGVHTLQRRLYYTSVVMAIDHW